MSAEALVLPVPEVVAGGEVLVADPLLPEEVAVAYSMLLPLLTLPRLMALYMVSACWTSLSRMGKDVGTSKPKQ